MKYPALLAVVTAAFAAPQANVVFKSGVSLVRIDVEAVDVNGHVVPGLKQDDFRILDEGVAQIPGNFSFDEEPLDLILLFDRSGSMKGKLLSVVRATELGFHELHKGDRVSVWTFNDESMAALPFTEDLQAVNEAIVLRVPEFGFRGGSKPEMAAVEAVREFQSASNTRRKRAIVIVTNKSGRGASETAGVHEMWEENAVVSELVLGDGAQTKLLESSGHAFIDRTGGASIVAGNPGEAFRDVVHYVRSGYTMYYAMPDAATGSERRVQVELTPEAAKRLPNVRIRARSGYVVP